MSFLDRIRPAKEAEAAALKAAHAAAPPVRPDGMPIRDFAEALRRGTGLIAEVKRTSPSRPDLRREGPVGALARTYERCGACALSIVTDAAHFGTSLDDVAELRAACALPVLTKDFIIDAAQIKAAWAAGADAVLLIVRMLEAAALADLLAEARNLGLAVLVETHSEDEIAMALEARADLVGVNNRNLATLTTDLAHGESLLPLVRGRALAVTESGLEGRADVERMARAGAEAFLVGHGLLLSRDPGRRVAEMSGREAEGSRRVKICGLTDPADARQAFDAGASFLGLIFADSPRRIDPDRALEIRRAVPGARLCGVFQDEDPAVVARIAAECELDLVQLHGRETPESCSAVARATGLPLIKALRPAEVTESVLEAYADAAYILVDRPKGLEGAAVSDEDLRAAASLVRDAGREVLLAGGLNPENVAEAVRATRPFGVDASSGVETEPGRKDHAAVSTFILEATS